MHTNNAIILGDIHLGKGTNIGKMGVGLSLNSRINDQLEILEFVLQKAEEKLSNDIIITGDIFEDVKPSADLVSLFTSWLYKCSSHGIRVHVIYGNHDILRSGFKYSSSLDIIANSHIDNIFFYNDIETIYIGTTAYTLLPFRDRKSFNLNSNAEAASSLASLLCYELASIPVTYTKVLIGHIAIEGALFVGDEVDDVANELFLTKDMLKGYDYTWMGHVHKPQVVHKSPYIAHIGSMDISDFGEVDHKKIIVYCEKNQDFCFEHIDIPSRPLKKIEIVIPDVKDTTEYVLQQLEKLNLDKSIVKIEISHEKVDGVPVNKKQIQKLLEEKNVFNVASLIESKKTEAIKKKVGETFDVKMNVNSAISRYCSLNVPKDLQDSFNEISKDLLNELKLKEK